jgi:hypothetical protein
MNYEKEIEEMKKEIEELRNERREVNMDVNKGRIGGKNLIKSS